MNEPQLRAGGCGRAFGKRLDCQRFYYTLEEAACVGMHALGKVWARAGKSAGLQSSSKILLVSC